MSHVAVATAINTIVRGVIRKSVQSHRRRTRYAKEQGTKKHQDMITRIALQGPVDGILHEHFAKLVFNLTDCLADSQMLSNCLTFTFIDSLIKTQVFFVILAAPLSETGSVNTPRRFTSRSFLGLQSLPAENCRRSV